MTFAPFDHVPSGAVPSPPPSTITVTGRAITTHSPTACLAAALAMPAEWARVDATISEHCPDAVSCTWQPCAGWGLGLARDAAMPPPVITTNTPEGGQTYWWDIRQPPSAAEQCRELVERFEREYPDDAAMLNDLRALTDLLDECAANEYADLPQPSTWTSTGTGVQYYNPDPAATMNLVSIHEGGGGIESFGFGFTIAMVIVAVLAVLLQ